MTFDAAALVAAATQSTGLEDFGDPAFRDGLDVLCDALENEARLNDLGRAALVGNITSALGNRLQVVEWTRAHPWVRDEAITRPLVVVGMFRAGTTLFSYLLDQDPANRALLGWEAASSVPPSTPQTHRSDPRVDLARIGMQMLEQINPQVAVVHHEEPDGPTECISVMSQDFKSLSWEAIANVPSYGEWLLQVDQLSAYRYHRAVLQVLQSAGVRGRWTLKSPHHAIALEPLTSVYPDAQLVLLHRDPVVLCASVCSLISTLSRTFSDADHVAYIARHWTAMLDESVRRIEAFRSAHPEHPIVDVHYADLVRDPVATVQSVYRQLGSELDPVAAERIGTYAAEHPKGAFGRHGYDLATYGLDADELAERFSGYIERYGVERESARS